MTPSISPIPTKYKGVTFRSRLEARWAVFFDNREIEWRFELEGFVLNDGTKYLPDFYLPKFPDPYHPPMATGIYLEVKPTGGDFFKARCFAAEGKIQILLAEGEPEVRSYTICDGRSDGSYHETEVRFHGFPWGALAYPGEELIGPLGLQDGILFARNYRFW